MKGKTISFLLILLLSYSNFAYSINNLLTKQDFKRLSVFDGLVSNEVTCVLQDSEGFVWFGTKNGLSRYDGYQFQNYKSNYSNPYFFSGNHILALAEDHKDQLWIGTTTGLNILDLKTKQTHQLEHLGLKEGNITSIVFSNDNIAFISADEGLFRYDGKSLTLIKADKNKKNIAGPYVKSLFIDSKDILWIAAWNDGYSVYDIEKDVFTDYPYLKNKKNIHVSCFFEDKDNNIWISTWDKAGVIKISNPHIPEESKIEEFIPIRKKTGLKPPVVFDIEQDSKYGYIWLATANGLQIITPDEVLVYNKSNTSEILVDEIYTLFKDRTGVLWFSMIGAGVNSVSFNRSQFSHFYLTSLLENQDLVSSVTSVYEDSRHNVWLGLKGLGLGLYNKKTNDLVLYKNHPQLCTMSDKINAIMSFHVPKNHPDKLFMGSRYDGLYLLTYKSDRIDKVTKISLGDMDRYNNLGVFDIEEDQNGNIWLASSEGLLFLKIDQEGNYIFSGNVSLGEKKETESINCLLVDKEDNIWVGTSKCLYRIMSDQTKTAIYSLKNNNINNNEILSIHQDRKQRIWVGSQGGGVSKYNRVKDKFEIIENIELFPDDAIYSIEEDHFGSLWLSTGNGLVCYNEDLPINQKFRIFSNYDGLNIYMFNPKASFISKNNELLFGGSNGFISFFPPAIVNNNVLYSPIITNLYLNNHLLGSDNGNSWQDYLQELPPYTHSVTLPYNERNIMIEFSSLYYDKPKSIKYAYKLEGLENEWVYVDSKKRFASYNNLPHGKYTFVIKAAGESGNWSTENKLTIQVASAPWNMWWAYCIYVIIALSVIVFTYRFIANKIKFKRMLAIQQIEKEKSEEVYQTKMRFFANISHEFFTPITILMCALEDIATRNPQESASIKTIKANLNRLVRLLEQIVEFRRLETGNAKIKLSQIEAVTFLKEFVKINFAPLKAEKNINFTFEAYKPEIVAYTDVDKLDKIIYNLLSNAFKYNKDNGQVKLIVNRIDKNEHSYLEIIVSDTGIGMSNEIKDNLFKRFYVGNKNLNVKSIGIGLSLTRDLVEILQGTISVLSKQGEGTTVNIAIPIDKSSFENVEYTEVEIDVPNEQHNDCEQEEEDSIFSLPLTIEKDKLSVLIVEDNKELLNILVSNMKSDFNTYSASNGLEALDVLKKENINIIITDVRMPKMNGIEFSKEVKRHVEFSHIPIIMLTARHSSEDKIEGFEAGADVYVTKPFEVCVLIANMHSLIRNRKIVAETFKKQTDAVDLNKYSYNQTDKMFLEKVIAYIETNALEKDFMATDLYKEMNMSQPTFYRKLHAMIEMSPNELIRKIKMKLACRLLLDGNMNISEVCYQLGFSEPRYFSSVFKKEIGVTPSDYIKQKTNGQ